MFLSDLFVTFVYQPFFNVLVGFYWLIGLITDGHADMGLAVILLTILIRFILLPISLSGHRSEKEKRGIANEIAEIDNKYSADPITANSEKKKVFRKSKKVFVSEIINLVIQVSIALMLWRIFTKGFTGADLHLIYPFMPEVDVPFNLVFLGKYDLTRPNIILNLIQSSLIFILETITIYSSPFKAERKEVVRMQLVLPVVSFLIFMGLPAGKKLFVITTLIFSIILTSILLIINRFKSYKELAANKIEDDVDEEEKLVTLIK